MTNVSNVSLPAL